MKKFTKGTLTTIVEDDDKRVADYRANGWKEENYQPPVPTNKADKTLAKAMKDAAESESKMQEKGKKDRKGAAPPDKKVNEAIEVNNEANAESEAVDDGLMPKEGA